MTSGRETNVSGRELGWYQCVHEAGLTQQLALQHRRPRFLQLALLWSSVLWKQKHMSVEASSSSIRAKAPEPAELVTHCQ